MSLSFAILEALRPRSAVVAFVLGAAFSATMIIGWYLTHQITVEPTAEQSTAECIAQYFAKNALTLDNTVLANAADSLCYSVKRHEYLLRDFKIRRDAYAIQPFETKVIMWMVVALVAGGVYLAWLQLRASYELGNLGKKVSIDNAVSNVKIAGMSVGSSVVGVIILAISFGFFGIYVKYVYTIDDASSLLPSDQRPAAISSQPDADNGIGPPQVHPKAPKMTLPPPRVTAH
jgi:hypothetical protein